MLQTEKNWRKWKTKYIGKDVTHQGAYPSPACIVMLSVSHIFTVRSSLQNQFTIIKYDTLCQ